MKTTRNISRFVSVITLSITLAGTSLPGRAADSLVVTPPAANEVACVQCGMVEDIREVRQEAETTGLGTVAGGLIGGILGRQLGEDGSTLGMLLGLAGGAYAGNKFEQYRNRSSRYEVLVRMDDGRQRSLNFDSRPVWQVGERIRLGTSRPHGA